MVATVFRLSRRTKRLLSRPMGRLVRAKVLVKTLPKSAHLTCVGDIVSFHAQRLGYRPQVLIVDGKTERKMWAGRKPKGRFIELRARNPPSTITQEAWDSVKEAFSHSRPVKITIKGEEDLMGLPVVFFAPPSAYFIYGQRGKGMVIVKATRSMKKKVEGYIGKKRLGTAIVAGSWDRLHSGHRYLLLTAFEHGRKVMIGLTTDTFLKSMGKKGRTQSFRKRKSGIEIFLKEFGLMGRTRIFPLDGPIGRALYTGDALVFGEDVKKTALKINSMRKKAGRNPLRLVMVRRLKARDRKELSARRIRNGEIDVDGRPAR